MRGKLKNSYLSLGLNIYEHLLHLNRLDLSLEIGSASSLFSYDEDNYLRLSSDSLHRD